MYMFLESFQSFGLHLVRSGDKKVPTTSPKYTPNSCVDTLPPCESLKTFSNHVLLQTICFKKFVCLCFRNSSSGVQQQQFSCCIYSMHFNQSSWSVFCWV